MSTEGEAGAETSPGKETPNHLSMNPNPLLTSPTKRTLIHILLAKGRGEIQVFPDHIEGRRSFGAPFNIPMDQITEVLLSHSRIALKGKENEILLVESPKDARIGGLIWLCKAYGDWNPKIWEYLAQALQEEGKANNKEDAQKNPEANDHHTFLPATRHFLAEDGTPAFGDHGFLIPEIAIYTDHAAATLRQPFYFPQTAMFPILGHDGSPRRLHHRAGASGATLLQIDPSPDSIPVAAFAEAMIRAKAGDERWEELAENHGGNRCIPVQDGVWEGECLGYPVKVEAV
jgi:hypothetical protein